MSEPENAALKNLPPLREVIKSVSLSAKRALGQNFLTDLNVTRKIARAAGAGEGGVFLEIGSGPGGLTRALLEEGAEKVIVIEKDARCRPILEEISAAAPGRLEIILGDALKLNWAGVTPPVFNLAANLPYNISSEVLIHMLTGRKGFPKPRQATLMFQLEFAERLCAGPDTEAYGRLSVIAALCADTKIMFELPPSVFTPAPKVRSAVVKVTPKQTPPDFPVARLEAITAAAFSGRRKMIKSALKPVFANPVEVLESLNVKPDRRAENLPPETFAALARIPV